MSEKLSFMDMRDFLEKNGGPTSNLTLRDYFAAKAMQALVTNLKSYDFLTHEQRAKFAYMQADAMLEARK